MKIIGSADDFWRIRITRVDTSEELDFSWRDDVLYRTHQTAPVRERNLFHVEAVRVDDREDVRVLRTFEHRDEAEEFAQAARTALVEMTKSQFEQAYVDSGDHSSSLEQAQEDE